MQLEGKAGFHFIPLANPRIPPDATRADLGDH